MNRLPFIDALRGLAIFGVLIVHSSQSVAGLSKWGHSLASQGARGVQLFFAISAFTLFLSLASRKKVEIKPVLNFFIRRFFRIAPLFYCAIIFYTLLTYWQKGNGFSFEHLLAMFTFINGWYPKWINSVVPGSWTIAVEMTFYLMVPYLFQKVTNLDKAIYLTLTSLILNNLFIIILRRFPLYPNEEEWETFLFYWLPNQFPVFCLGFVLYFLVTSNPTANSAEEYISKSSKRTRAFTLLLIAIFLLVTLPFGSYAYIHRHFLYGIAFVLLALSLSMHPFSFFVNRFWCYLGKVSYSAYLTHFAMIPIANYLVNQGSLSLHLHLPPLLHLIVLCGVLLALTIVVASLTYQFIEVPGQGWGRAVITKLEKG